mmetsp:Transcript_7584/g.13673  ORF Transcript_7584/g.13673 Transcript_7584/m.13673 type:complete len:352 (+) Transcript_7584:347-1402(+)
MTRPPSFVLVSSQKRNPNEMHCRVGGILYRLPLPTTETVLLNPSQNDIKSSQLLRDPVWVARIISVFDPQGKLIKEEIIEDFTTKADCLLNMLQFRLSSYHIPKRVPKSKHNHWSLEWAKKNLAVVAAYMILFKHTKMDISVFGESKCLLAKPTGNSYLLCSNEEGGLVGAYLSYDANEEEWVRAGKATAAGKGNKCGGMKGRWHDHEKRHKAHDNVDDSQYYDLYPSKESIRSKNPMKAGLFENLQQFVAAGFAPNDATAAQFEKDYASGGLFFYTSDEKASVLRTNFSGKLGNQKFSEMVAYLFELGYDLALSRSHNVSESPGLEGCGLRFDKRRAGATIDCEGDGDDE